MARTPLLARMTLDEIRCNEEGDGFGSAEPYLWTVFFKIDGDTVIVGDDTFLQGECTIMASDGSHGNILPHTVPIAGSSQGNWRWCNRCQGLFYGGNVAGSRCPAGGAHTPPNQSGSADYILPESGPIL
jgi:hypothetical protein